MLASIVRDRKSISNIDHFAFINILFGFQAEKFSSLTIPCLLIAKYFLSSALSNVFSHKSPLSLQKSHY